MTPLAVTPRFHKQFLLARNAVRYCNELRRDFGDFVLARGLLDFYFLNSPDLIGTVLLNKEGTIDRDAEKNKIYERLRNIGRTGLATSGAQHWRSQRRRIAPLFTASATRGFAETMIATAEEWAERWAVRSQDGEPFDMKTEMNELALDVNTRCLFGAKLRDEQARLQSWFSAMKAYIEGFPYPVLGEWWFPSLLNLHARSALRGFDRYALGLITERRAAPLDPDAKDMITRMLSARDPETGRGMDDEQICHEMLTFLIAGFETTSSALLWTFYQLSRAPEVEARMHAELDSVLGDRAMTPDDLPRLDYTSRVIDEVMRQTPSAWFMARTALQDIELGGQRIIQGSNMLMSIPTLHNNPDVWPDPGRFDPDRFLPEQVAQRSPNAYLPFGRGPHACIGAHFSRQELLVMVAALGRRFRVPSSGPDIDPSDVRPGMSMYPRRSLRVRVERRRAPTAGSASRV